MYNIYKIATISPSLTLAKPTKNAQEVIKLIKEANSKETTVALFPELTLTGYSWGSIFSK